MYDNRPLKQVHTDSAREHSLAEFVDETKGIIEKGEEDGFEPDEVAIERVQRIAKARSTTPGMIVTKAGLLYWLDNDTEQDLLAVLADDAATGVEKLKASILLDAMRLDA